jgi:hypothetical protein
VKAVAFVGKKPFHRSKKEGTESTALGIRDLQEILLHKQRKEPLGQVLGLIAVITTSSNESENRVPIGFAQPGESWPRIHHRVMGGLENKTPGGRLEF